MIAIRHLPNAITCLRMGLVVPLVWLIYTGNFKMALIIAVIAGATDALDGFLAKHYGWQSWLGGMLDPIADKLLLVASFLALTLVGAFPLWLVALVVGRDLIIILGAMAYYTLIGVFTAAPSVLSKLTTVVQIVCVVFALTKLSALVPIPGFLNSSLMVITGVLTVASGIHYVVTWSYRARDTMRSK